MNNVVPLKKIYVPVIVRIVLGRNITHRTLIVKSSETAPKLTLKALEDLLIIEKEDDWLEETIDEYLFALTEIRKKANDSLKESVVVNRSGFFILVRPRLGQMEISSLQI